VISDPPWGLLRKAEWGADPYQRFRYGPLRGRRGDYGFVQHTLASLNVDGQGLLLLPVSALFRSGFELDIRRNLIQADVIDAVITLPAGALMHTGVSAVLLVFRYQKEEERRQMIRMIDAFGTFDGRRPLLSDALVDRIVQSVQSPNEEVGLARTVAVENVSRQDFSLLPGTYLKQPITLVSSAEMGQTISQRLAAYEEAHRVLQREMDRLAELLRS